MDPKDADPLITINEGLHCTGMQFNGPRLTPTGKISHAKTRVYTQRYRKEWEQMPDFKGWLTSVPFQATRAYCTYCNKNLHAHRLSLLKHTCTMKHQRAALLHQHEQSVKQAARIKIPKIETGYEEEGDIEQVHLVQREGDREGQDEAEEYEYVVERLEMEEDELDEGSRHCEEDGHHPGVAEQNEQDEDEMESVETDEDDPMSLGTSGNISRPDGEKRRDAIAKALFNAHGGYLDGSDEQCNVELEMVVTSEDGVVQETEHDISETALEEDCAEDSRNDDHENTKQSDSDGKFAEEDSSEIGSETETSPSLRVRDSTVSYENLSNKSSNSGSFGRLKTVKLGNPGKTVMVRTGPPFLRNVKVADIPRTDKKSTISGESSPKTGQNVNNGFAVKQRPFSAVPGTSGQQSGTKNEMATTKPCISTHVMDTSKGLPVGGLQVSLYKLMDGRWTFLNESNTSPSGHCNDLVVNSKCNFTAGRYKMHFDVDKYFTLRRIETMYPFIEIVFDVKNPTGNYHIPVLLSPFGYTTYRGSDR